MSASCAGLVDAGQHVRDAARAAVLEHRLDDGAVLARELAGRARKARLVELLDLDVQRALGAGDAAADPGPADAAHDERARSRSGSSPALSIWVIVPTVAKRAVDPGHQDEPAADGLGRAPRPAWPRRSRG